MPENFAEGLDPQSRHRVVNLLNGTLADAIALTLAVKEAHWNLKGPGFIGVHELLDEVADRLQENVDDMAERAVALGGLARGTLENVARASRIEPYPSEAVSIEDHLRALKGRFEAMNATIRSAIDEAEEAGDAGTADLLTGVSRSLDKDTWFLGANLPEARTIGTGT